MGNDSVVVNVNIDNDNDDDNGNGQEKVTICHEGQTLEVAASALQAHYDHGDTLGPCPDESMAITIVDEKDLIIVEDEKEEKVNESDKSTLRRLKDKITGNGKKKV